MAGTLRLRRPRGPPRCRPNGPLWRTVTFECSNRAQRRETAATPPKEAIMNIPQVSRRSAQKSRVRSTCVDARPARQQPKACKIWHSERLRRRHRSREESAESLLNDDHRARPSIVSFLCREDGRSLRRQIHGLCSPRKLEPALLQLVADDVNWSSPIDHDSCCAAQPRPKLATATPKAQKRCTALGPR